MISIVGPALAQERAWKHAHSDIAFGLNCLTINPYPDCPKLRVLQGLLGAGWHWVQTNPLVVGPGAHHTV